MINHKLSLNLINKEIASSIFPLQTPGQIHQVLPVLVPYEQSMCTSVTPISGGVPRGQDWGLHCRSLQASQVGLDLD
jgi:hypothetical protein